MKIAIIGAGNVGKALATSALRAGHQVTLSASNPKHAAEAAKATGAHAGPSNSDAVKDAELVIVAVGIEPNVESVNGSGVATRDGILVDATCRTNVARIFAAGDVANHLHPIFGRVRVEHYNNARLNSAIGYITPMDILAGREQEIHAKRDRKLEEARKQRQIRR